MNHGPLIFLGVFLGLAGSWWGMVACPQLQFGGLQPKAPSEGDPLYPNRRPGQAEQGYRVYVREGCVSCHSQATQDQRVSTDSARGWGPRQSVPQDFIWDHPVQAGTSRLGPDLANVGARQSNTMAMLVHLWNPRVTMPKSMMPAYQHLFTVRPVGARPSPDALLLPGNLAPAAREVIPTDDARNLVAYLQSLNAGVMLFEAPTNAAPAAAKPAAPAKP